MWHLWLVLLPSHEWPAPHATQERSASAAGARDSRSSAAHSLTGAHAAPLVAAEKVSPATHAAHVRSRVDEPSTTTPEPDAHERHAWHDALSAPEKRPAAHAVHAAPPAAAYCPALHLAHDAPPAAAAEPAAHAVHEPAPTAA